MHVETDIKKLDDKAYHIYTAGKRNVTEGRNVTFIETPARAMPPPGEYEDDHVREVRDYISLVDSTSTMHLDIDPNEINGSRELAPITERIQDLTRRDLSAEGGASSPAGRGEPEPLTAERGESLPGGGNSQTP